MPKKKGGSEKLEKLLFCYFDLLEKFHLCSFEEEIAIAMLGIAGIIALVTGQSEVAMFCFGVIAGYLGHGYQKPKKK